MAKAPNVKKETNATRLQKLKDTGFVDKSVKTFNKSVKTVWQEFSTVFPTGRVFRKSTLVNVSNETKAALKSVNMLVIGNKLVFPAEGAQVRVRETKKGVFVDAKRVTDATGKRIKNGPGYSIILAKDGNHIKYARELERKSGGRKNREQVTQVYGTLKTSTFEVGGKKVETFMRDITRTHESIEDAIGDDRYNISADDDIQADDYDTKQEYLDDLAEMNGVAALIRVTF